MEQAFVTVFNIVVLVKMCFKICFHCLKLISVVEILLLGQIHAELPFCGFSGVRVGFMNVFGIA